MPHLDPDTLALLALGEAVTDSGDDAHLAECAQCSDELAALAAAVRVGRDSLPDGDLAVPDERVWRAISTELGLKPRRLAASRSRRFVPLLIAAITVLALVVGGAAVWQALRPSPDTLLASAALKAFPAWPSATGSARLDQHADGSRTVTVTLDAPGAGDGYREVWLITSDASDLISLGVLDGTTATFDVPRGVDTTRFDLVDVSEEPFDGDSAHSGDSIVRGKLVGDPIEG